MAVNSGGWGVDRRHRTPPPPRAADAYPDVATAALLLVLMLMLVPMLVPVLT
jgi:hypothetical protein